MQRTWLRRYRMRAVYRLAGYSAAAAGVAAMTALIRSIPGAGHIANVSMLYLLVVIAVALRFGSGPAIGASILAFLASDWFFVEPLYAFTVRDPAEWLALIMFLVTAATTGQLTALLRRQADEARRRERETAALAEVSWAVASQVDRDRALAEVLRRAAEVAPIVGAANLTQSGERAESIAHWPPESAASSAPASEDAARLVEFVYATGQAVAWDRDRRHWDKALGSDHAPAYLPLLAENRVLGVLCIELPPGYHLSPAERRVVDSLAHHAAVVLERERLARAETRANALAEADRLKTALLAMVSHDFRSPLASIKASATAALQGASLPEPEAQRELQQGIIREVDRLDGMVANILALSRLEADAWRPQREGAAVEEVIEAGRAGLAREADRRVDVRLAADGEEVWLDPIQIGQVLHNLLDNALKYSPPEARVELRAARDGEDLLFEVRDRGPGLPRGEEERVFERFYRAPALRESSIPGVGIGLAVCRGLVEAHGGTLTARNREGGGAVFQIRLPQLPGYS